MAQSKVLIVEDDEGLREALVDTLALAGYEWLKSRLCRRRFGETEVERGRHRSFRCTNGRYGWLSAAP